METSMEKIARLIVLVQGQRVILDRDLASLYGVSTKRLNEQVKRNRDRFPSDFLFILTKQEVMSLRSRFATSSFEWGGTRYPPMAFTEHGVIMAANILRSERAVHVSIQVVRAFVRLREIFAAHKDLALKLEALEKKYDKRFRVVFDAIRELMRPEPSKTARIGFRRR
jgi:hypothetical protein